MKRIYWMILAAALIVVIMVVAGITYASRFAKSVNLAHTPPGIATTCGTPVPTTGLRTFQIMPAQSTASYRVHEDLILQNLPDNVAVGKTHSIQGSFSVCNRRFSGGGLYEYKSRSKNLAKRFVPARQLRAAQHPGNRYLS